MKEELKRAFINRIEEILDKPLRDVKIQIDYHYNEVPMLRYDVTEVILPEESENEM